MRMPSIVCSAPGRICLFGDHMDWCGFQVITAAVDLRIFLEGCLTETEFIRSYSFAPFSTHDEFTLTSFDLNPSSDLRYVRGVIKAMQKVKMPYEIRGMDLHFHKAETISGSLRERYRDLPVSKGLSSSAAMSAVTAAVTDLLHRFNSLHEKSMKRHIESTPFQRQCAEMGYQGERIELGINCGQMDPYASAFGGFLHIDCSTEPAAVEKHSPENEMLLVIGDTNQPKDTPRILEWLGKRYEHKEATFTTGVTNIVEIVKQARKELSRKAPDPEKLGSLMNQNQHHIANHLKVSGNCPISPSRLDDLIEAALEGGAHGAKVTGSGGGGCMIALCNENTFETVEKEIKRAGGTTMVTNIANQGVKLEAIRR